MVHLLRRLYGVDAPACYAMLCVFVCMQDVLTCLDDGGLPKVHTESMFFLFLSIKLSLCRCFDKLDNR